MWAQPHHTLYYIFTFHQHGFNLCLHVCLHNRYDVCWHYHYGVSDPANHKSPILFPQPLRHIFNNVSSTPLTLSNHNHRSYSLRVGVVTLVFDCILSNRLYVFVTVLKQTKFYPAEEWLVCTILPAYSLCLSLKTHLITFIVVANLQETCATVSSVSTAVCVRFGMKMSSVSCLDTCLSLFSKRSSKSSSQ